MDSLGNFNLNVFKRESGAIWTNKLSSKIKGLNIKLTNSSSDETNDGPSFVHAVFDQLETVLVVGDQIGNVYLFDFGKNRFQIICKLSHCITSLAWTGVHQKDILVATSNNMLYCYDSMSGSEVTEFKGHQSSVSSISVDKYRTRFLSSSLEQAIVWSINNFTVIHRLTLKQKVHILKVFFMPHTDDIVTCFVDGSVFIWDSNDIACKHQILTLSNIRTLDISRDGELLSVGTRKGLLSVYSLADCESAPWSLETLGTLSSIRQIAFVPHHEVYKYPNMIALLTIEGSFHVYQLFNSKHLFELKVEKGKFVRMIFPSKGHHVALLSTLGGIYIYDLSILLPNLQTPDTKPQLPPFRNKITIKVNLKDDPSLTPGLAKSKLIKLLDNNRQFPSKYRVMIWSQLLKLPENIQAFNVLVSRVHHVKTDLQLENLYPISSLAIKNSFHRMISLLVLWCPLFERLNYLPFFLFPFVKVLHQSPLILFETLLTLVCSWCQNWFVFYPLPPLNILTSLENLLGFHDPGLLQHYVNYDITTQIYGWPLMQSAFSEVFPKEEWLKLWDNLFCKSPSFVIFVVLSYSIVGRNTLLRLHNKETIQSFFEEQNNVPINLVLDKAYLLEHNTPESLDPSPLVGSFQRLTIGTYPMFTNYPKFSLDEDEERKRICDEEFDYLQKRKTNLRLEDAQMLHKNLQSDPYVGRRLEKERRQEELNELRSIESNRRNLMSHMGNQNKKSLKPDRSQTILRNTGLLLQKKLLEQEVCRQVSNTGHHGTINISKPPKQSEATIPKDVIESENQNLKIQIKDLKNHLQKVHKNSVSKSKIIRSHKTVITPRDTSPAEKRMEKVNDILELRGKLASKNIKKLSQNLL